MASASLDHLCECGCGRPAPRRFLRGHGKRIDLTGRRFGRLVVQSCAGIKDQPNGTPRLRWICLCDCGQTVTTAAIYLTTGKKQSCGCLARDIVLARNTRHGMTFTREYRAWHNMRVRCYWTKGKSFAAYGGRGIRVCNEWRRSFEAFYRDMGPCPDGYEIDRIDPNGNYEPRNCRWASIAEQANNKRNTVRIDVDGVPMPVADAARLTGLPDYTVYRRAKLGETIADVRKRRATRTHCAHGHPLSGDNLGIGADGRRRCKTCHREAASRSKERRRG